MVLVVLGFAACNSKPPAKSTAPEPAKSVAETPAKTVAEKPAKAVAKKPPAAVAKESQAAAKPFHNDPAANALYKQMIKAMRRADTLLSRQGRLP